MCSSSQRSVGNNGLLCFGCPGCPPCFLFDLGFLGTGLACGCCVLGGREEFCGVLLSRASNSAILASSSRMIICASGVCRAISSSVIPSSDIPKVSPKWPIARRPVSPRPVNGYGDGGFQQWHLHTQVGHVSAGNLSGDS